MSCHIFRHARLFPREGGGYLRDYWLKMENNVTFSFFLGGGGIFCVGETHSYTLLT